MNPTHILHGNLWEDGDQLELAVEEMRGAGSGGAFAGGTVDYDGRFEFAFYADFSIAAFHGTSQVAAPLWFIPEVGEAEYCAMVRAAQELIAAGDIYQVNLARRFVAEASRNSHDYFQKLQAVSPAPFAAWLRQESREVASASPECFLKMSGRRIITEPIKGTRRRAGNRDEEERRELLGSAKERAELLMIADLERNDLGQICEFGTIQAVELAQLRSFSQVHHLVAKVAGTLRTEVSHVGALRACFPGGSITGAPKKRAREIIQSLERGARGLYTGAIGWFGADGTAEFSIAIRTVIFELTNTHFQVGAGIVADSMAAAEFAETNDKAAGLLRAAGQ